MIQDGATEDYADAVCTYLALAVGNIAVVDAKEQSGILTKSR